MINKRSLLQPFPEQTECKKLLKLDSVTKNNEEIDSMQYEYHQPEFVEDSNFNKNYFGASLYFDALAKTTLKLDSNMQYKDYLIKKSIKDTLNTQDDALFKTKKISQNSTIRENLTNTIYELYKIFRYNPKYQIKIASKYYKNKQNKENEKNTPVVFQTGKEPKVSCFYLTLMTAYLYIKNKLLLDECCILDFGLEDIKNCVESTHDNFSEKKSLKYVSLIKTASREYGLNLCEETKSFNDQVECYIKNLLEKLETCNIQSQLGMEFKKKTVLRIAIKLFNNDIILKANFSTRKVKCIALALIYIALRLCDIKVKLKEMVEYQKVNELLSTKYITVCKIVHYTVDHLFKKFRNYVGKFATIDHHKIVKKQKNKYIVVFLELEKDLDKYFDENFRICIRDPFVIISLKLILKKKVIKAFL